MKTDIRHQPGLRRCRLGVCVGVLWAVMSWAGPLLEVTPAVLDLGRQEKNLGTYQLTYTVRNAGDALLEISAVKTGCGCTSYRLGKKQLAPGEATELHGVFEAGRFEGPVTKGAIIYSNCSRVRTFPVVVKALLPYSHDGARLWPVGGNYMARVHGAEGLSASIWVENCRRHGEIGVEQLNLPVGWSCATALPETVGAESRKRLVLRRAGLAAGRLDRLPFQVRTTDKVSPVLHGTLSFVPRPSPPQHRAASGEAGAAAARE